MPLVPIAIPPGLYMNGTYYDAKNRWHNANRVRWHNGSMRPIGGWLREQDYSGVDIRPLTNVPQSYIYRDGFSWVSNQGSRYRVFGSNGTLEVWLPDATIDGITPAGFTGSPPVPIVSDGYGKWLYGRSVYGARRPSDPNAIPAIWRWSFDTWGEDLIAGPAADAYPDTLYVWKPSLGANSPAEPIVGAPLDLTNFIVTDQRIVMGIGSGNEKRLVRWSDREDYSDWTPTQLNYAGNYFLQGNGDLLSIDRVLDQILILSETDAHVARWLGAPLVYGFTRVGEDCGPWNGSVVYSADRFAMWPGRRGFWMYDGTLKQVPCSIMDHIINDLSRTRITTAFVVGIPQYSEIWWFYQSETSTIDDVDTYVAYDYVDGTWTTGKLDRTCGIDGEVYVNPYMVSATEQAIYEHERDDVVALDTWAESGPLEIGNGDNNMAVRYIYPDTETFGDVAYTLYGQNQPTDQRYAYGPYQFNNPVSTRALGRSISMRVDGSTQTPKWQVGQKTRFDVAPMGTGRR